MATPRLHTMTRESARYWSRLSKDERDRWLVLFCSVAAENGLKLNLLGRKA